MADENQEELEQFLALFGEWGQDYALLACGLWVPSSNLLAIPPPSHHLYGDPLLRQSLDSKGQEQRSLTGSKGPSLASACIAPLRISKIEKFHTNC